MHGGGSIMLSVSSAASYTGPLQKVDEMRKKEDYLEILQLIHINCCNLDFY